MKPPSTGIIGSTLTVTDETCLCVARVVGVRSEEVESFTRKLQAVSLLYETVQVLAGALDLAYEAQEMPQPACSRFAWQILRSIKQG